MPLSKEFYLDEIRSKYPNSYNESLKDLPVKDLEDMLDFLEGALEKADGGSIGIEVLFGPKRDEFSIGGKAQRKVPYDPRASTLDYAAALDKVGAGTAEQKLKAFGDYAKNVASTGGKKVLQKLGDLTGYTQHNVNNQLLRNALEAGDINEKQYKLMGGYDVAQQFPGPQVTDDAMVGLSSLLYNAVKSGINIYDPQNPYAQYGQFSAPESIGLNMQGAKGLTATDKDIYERIISGKPVKSKTPLSESDFYNQFYGVPFEGFQGKAFKSLQKGDPNYDEVIRRGQTAGGFADLVNRGIIQAYTGPTDYKNYLSTFADGGRVGLFMGGPPLEGTALSIYNSMSAYGFSDQEIANALAERGLYTPGGTTEETDIIASAPNIINQDRGGDGPPNDPPKDPYGGLGYSSANFGLGQGINKDAVMDYEADAYEQGRTLTGQLNKIGLGIFSALKNIPTPFNLVRKGIEFAKQKELEKKEQEEAIARDIARSIQEQNRANRTGGYQSDFRQDRDFMEGRGTASEMGSSKDGGLMGYGGKSGTPRGVATMFKKKR